MLHLQLLEHWWQDVIQRTRADGVVQAIERFSRGLADLRQIITECSTNGRDERVDKGQHHVLRGRHHDLGQADAHALTLFRQRALKAFLQDWNDFRKNSLTQLLDKVAKSSSGHL